MKITITPPVEPVITINMSQREAELMCHMFGNLEHPEGMGIINRNLQLLSCQSEPVKPNEMAQLCDNMYTGIKSVLKSYGVIR